MSDIDCKCPKYVGEPFPYITYTCEPSSIYINYIMSPCDPISIEIPDSPTVPPIPGFGIPVPLKTPNLSLNLE